MANQIHFKDTGTPKSWAKESQNGAGKILSAPGAGKSAVICDIMASAATTISTATSGGGTIIMYCPAGHSNFRAPIDCGENTAVWSSDGNVTITYYIKDNNRGL
tara:strand:- start:241 stop:552 length:312 start_codon:yes stop_codon:yes gene_type:complete